MRKYLICLLGGEATFVLGSCLVSEGRMGNKSVFGVLPPVFRALEAWSFAGPRESVRHQYAPFSFVCVCVCVWNLRIKPVSLAVEAWSPNRWTAREFAVVLTLN